MLSNFSRLDGICVKNWYPLKVLRFLYTCSAVICCLYNGHHKLHPLSYVNVILVFICRVLCLHHWFFSFFLTQTTNIHPLIRKNPTDFFPTFACNHYFHRFLYRTTIKFSLVHMTHQCFEKNNLKSVALNIKKKVCCCFTNSLQSLRCDIWSFPPAELEWSNPEAFSNSVEYSFAFMSITSHLENHTI